MGIQRRLTIHGMRRTYNNLMRQTVTDTIVVQALTGHSSDRMTEHYSHVSKDEKQDALQKVFEKLGLELKNGTLEGKVADQVADRS